jgi:hypothetical protein
VNRAEEWSGKTVKRVRRIEMASAIRQDQACHDKIDKNRFGASPSLCRRVGKPSEKGLGTKWLKCLGPLGSITAAEKHSNTKHWLNNMIIIPIEVFRKYLYNFGV